MNEGLLINAVKIITYLAQLGIVLYCVMTWVIKPTSSTGFWRFFIFVERKIAYFLYPVKLVMAPVTKKIGIDLSPCVAILLLYGLRKLLIVIIELLRPYL